MFELTDDEFKILRRQIGTSSLGGTRYAPMAFTEQGVAMLSSVINTERAIKANIAIMRAFVAVRKMIASHTDLVRKIDEMEKKYDKQFAQVFVAIRQLMEPVKPPAEPKRKIGFNK